MPDKIVNYYLPKTIQNIVDAIEELRKAVKILRAE